MIRNSGLCFCVFILCSFSILAQEASELEKRHGFKDIKLNTPVDSVKGVKLKKEFKERNEFDAKLYEVDHPAYKKIGEVNVKQVELKAYKGLIYQIFVVADKDPRLMKALESIYGKADYDMKNETYFWKGSSIMLKFKSHSKNELEMVYDSPVVYSKMKEDKAKKIENIADDF
ncbi:hypothetical protein [Chryseosolibacter indicus]|uniref:DUF4252 domain-containing protein n=1 Tax=Chryseosolibacter indicus TaxID=2782351 RepID=A0ABS5VPQ0_9BACT|nr:hypothetical protein [Chryseosolibacter indicus]MBT1703422.1 hypothetical protein [Chryseosolibacter indicus]